MHFAEISMLKVGGIEKIKNFYSELMTSPSAPGKHGSAWGLAADAYGRAEATFSLAFAEPPLRVAKR